MLSRLECWLLSLWCRFFLGSIERGRWSGSFPSTRGAGSQNPSLGKKAEKAGSKTILERPIKAKILDMINNDQFHMNSGFSSPFRETTCSQPTSLVLGISHKYSQSSSLAPSTPTCEMRDAKLSREHNHAGKRRNRYKNRMLCASILCLCLSPLLPAELAFNLMQEYRGCLSLLSLQSAVCSLHTLKLQPCSTRLWAIRPSDPFRSHDER